MSKRMEALVFYLGSLILLLIITGYAFALADILPSMRHPVSCMSAPLDLLALIMLFTGPAISGLIAFLVADKQALIFKLNLKSSIKLFILYLDIGIIGYFLILIAGFYLPLMTESYTPRSNPYMVTLPAIGIIIALYFLAIRQISRPLKKPDPLLDDQTPPADAE
jgi:hypothetical protein